MNRTPLMTILLTRPPTMTPKPLTTPTTHLPIAVRRKRTRSRPYPRSVRLTTRLPLPPRRPRPTPPVAKGRVSRTSSLATLAGMWTKNGLPESLKNSENWRVLVSSLIGPLVAPRGMPPRFLGLALHLSNHIIADSATCSLSMQPMRPEPSRQRREV